MRSRSRRRDEEEEDGVLTLEDRTLNTLKNYGEPPELLKSNLTTATSFHQSQSPQSHDSGPVAGEETSTASGQSQEYGSSHSGHYPVPHNPNDPSIPHPHFLQATGSTRPHPHKEVHFSPRPSNHHLTNTYQVQHNHPGSSSNYESQSQQVLGISTLPRLHHPENNMKIPLATAANNVSVTATLPKKPIPPTRNLTNYTISQRQIFSLIMSLMTMGIL